MTIPAEPFVVTATRETCRCRVEAERFECVPAGEAWAVLRLLANLPSHLPRPSAPSLAIESAAGVTRLQARRRPARLRARSSGPRLLWRAEFVARIEDIRGPDACFELLLDGLAPLSLPAPVLVEARSRAGARYGRLGRIAALLVVSGHAWLAAMCLPAAAAGATVPATPTPAATPTPTTTTPTTATTPTTTTTAATTTSTTTTPTTTTTTTPTTTTPTTTTAGTTTTRQTGAADRALSSNGLDIKCSTGHRQGKGRSRHPSAKDHHGRTVSPHRGAKRSQAAEPAAPHPAFVPQPAAGAGSALAPTPADTALLRSIAGLYSPQPGPPTFLVPIFKAAGCLYHIPWQVLAAINSIETDYGRDLSISSAGAVGWMQFMPATVADVQRGRERHRSPGSLQPS